MNLVCKISAIRMQLLRCLVIVISLCCTSSIRVSSKLDFGENGGLPRPIINSAKMANDDLTKVDTVWRKTPKVLCADVFELVEPGVAVSTSEIEQVTEIPIIVGSKVGSVTNPPIQHTATVGKPLTFPYRALITGNLPPIRTIVTANFPSSSHNDYLSHSDVSDETRAIIRPNLELYSRHLLEPIIPGNGKTTWYPKNRVVFNPTEFKKIYETLNWRADLLNSDRFFENNNKPNGQTQAASCQCMPRETTSDLNNSKDENKPSKVLDDKLDYF